ncbi:MAG: stalk domain-containing protein, partial [Eubacteriales bacterium]
ASANAKSLYTVPTVSVGFNCMPWSKVRYPLMSMSDYAAAHKWVKEEYLPQYATEEWQKNFVMLSTWNEYGEGTYIMPTAEEKGFGYLDAVREAYTDEKASNAVNTVPTASQAYRINHLYPQNLHLLRRQGYYKETVDEDNLTPLFTLDLTKRTDYDLWGVDNGTKGSDGVSGHSTDDSIIIFQKLADEGIVLDNVSAVRITAKIPVGSSLEFFYITEDDQNWNQSKHAGFPAATTGDFAQYTLSVERLKAFKGKLYGFRVDPVSLPGLDFTVKSIEFLGEKGGKLSNKFTVNGVTAEPYFAPQRAENGDILLPFDPEAGLDFLLNTYFEWNRDTSELTLYFTDHTVVYTVGSDTYTLDGVSKKLPYKLSDLDGLPLLPIKTLCEEVGYTYTLNENNEIVIETPQKVYFEKDNADRVYGQWEFNTLADTEGWKSSFMSMFVNNGYVSCETMSSSTDPTIVYTDSLKLKASDYVRIEYRVRYRYNADKPHALTMYFGTNVNSGHSEDKTIKIPLNGTDSGGEWEVYTKDLSEVAQWKDIITSLRFDPFNATGYIDIDYIRFIPAEGVTPGPAGSSAQDDKDGGKTQEIVYPEPDIPTEDEEMGKLIWYNNFDETKYDAAAYADSSVRFAANGVSANVAVTDDPDAKKGGKALKITPNGAHGGYDVAFPKGLTEPGVYTFAVDIYVPEGAKIDPWLRFETVTSDGSKSDPNFWEGEKRVTSTGAWYTWKQTMQVTKDLSIIDYSVRKNTPEEYYVDNVRIYYMAE